MVQKIEDKKKENLIKKLQHVMNLMVLVNIGR